MKGFLDRAKYMIFFLSNCETGKAMKVFCMIKANEADAGVANVIARLFTRGIPSSVILNATMQRTIIFSGIN